MSGSSATLRADINRTAARFALYFSLDDPDRRTDAVSFISLVSDLSLLAAAQDVLTVVGHHLVERATDFALDKALGACRALKERLIGAVRDDKALRRPDYVATLPDSAEIDQLLDWTTQALKLASKDEMQRALQAGNVTVRNLVRTELKVPDSIAGDYAIEVTREIEVSVRKRR